MTKRFAIILAVLTWPAKASAYTADSTSYCLSGTMADGSQVRWGSVASNWHPLGTRITLNGPAFYGLRRFVVRDRIGYGSELDFWAPNCGQSFSWGRRTVTYKIGWRKRIGRVERVRARIKVIM